MVFCYLFVHVSNFRLGVLLLLFCFIFCLFLVQRKSHLKFYKKSLLNSKKNFQRTYLNNRWELGLHTLPLFSTDIIYHRMKYEVKISVVFVFFRWKSNGNFWKKNGDKSLNVNLNTVVCIYTLYTKKHNIIYIIFSNTLHSYY